MTTPTTTPMPQTTTRCSTSGNNESSLHSPWQKKSQRMYATEVDVIIYVLWVTGVTTEYLVVKATYERGEPHIGAKSSNNKQQKHPLKITKAKSL